MITSSIILSCFTIMVYLWVYLKVGKGDEIKDVRMITLLCIVSLTAGLLILTEGYFFLHCEAYYSGFTQNYIDAIGQKVGFVSACS